MNYEIGGANMIGELIKKYLKENGISQRFLSEKTGISQATMNAMLNGNRKMEATEYFMICWALHQPVDYFANRWSELQKNLSA